MNGMNLEGLKFGCTLLQFIRLLRKGVLSEGEAGVVGIMASREGCPDFVGTGGVGYPKDSVSPLRHNKKTNKSMLQSRFVLQYTGKKNKKIKPCLFQDLRFSI